MNGYDHISINESFRRAGGLDERPLARRTVSRFRRIILSYYDGFARDFPWRRTSDPYQLLVSEIMLQQTQTDRVASRFPDFIAAFPAVEDLARADLAAVLRVWQGMGYNRRALYLHRLAGVLMERHGGRVPDDPQLLRELPGIGAATAASIAAFAFDRPTVFIETNIRTVFLHFFYHGVEGVDDEALRPLVAQNLDAAGPARWYSALMDYGAMLKKTLPNPGRRSAHHARQSPFAGSRRQLRGAVLRAVLAAPGITIVRLARQLDHTVDAVANVVDGLIAEGMLARQGRGLRVPAGKGT